MRRRHRKSELEAVDKLVPKVLSDLGFEASARVLRLSEHWEEAVGGEVARHCWPTALRGEVLEATVDSSAWCQQLQLQREQILAALRRVAGEDAPGDLWLRVSGVDGPGEG